MPPKFDPNSEFDLFMKIKGGVNLPVTSLAPKVGPFGLPPKRVADQIFAATQDYKGIRVMVKVHVKQRQPSVSIVPTAASEIIKALNEGPRTVPKGEEHVHDGAIAFDEIRRIAGLLREKSYAVEFSGTVKEVLGTARSIGCNVTVEGQDYSAQEVIELIDAEEIEVQE
eukprot:gnl/Dysnectes_brevis/249_a280_11738.p1 GENE.gnl/Dysnectes_brevis/249_a280_11738~~gnl/Dysnectes_brevis/249_a280_11738.p1  ORF type:complete len:169 (-),score=51.90 gnl/Dysnectes_brevis/249_a280_11738:67-573(-)